MCVLNGVQKNDYLIKNITLNVFYSVIIPGINV